MRFLLLSGDQHPMSDCIPFRLFVGDQLPDVVPILLREMNRRGASVAGNSENGRFSVALPVGGSIRGSYRASGRSLAIEITSRPSQVSCGTIESKMQDFILDAKTLLRSQSAEQI